MAGELILKRMYAGKPYALLKNDLIEKINVNPVNVASAGQNITELVELHNYIIANFFQSIGIKSNNVMKRERLIRDEIESQDDFLQVSILEMLSSWQDGLDKVNEIYGTSFSVKLNPVLLNELMQQLDSSSEKEAAPAEDAAAPEEDAAAPEEDAAAPAEDAAAPEEDAAAPEEIIDSIEDEERIVQDVVNIINDAPEKEEGEESVQPEEEAAQSDSG